MTGPLAEPLTNRPDTAVTLASSAASYLNLDALIVGVTLQSKSHTLYLADRTRRLKPPILALRASIRELRLDTVLQSGLLDQGVHHQNWWFWVPYILLTKCTACLCNSGVSLTNIVAKSLKARNTKALKIADFGVAQLEWLGSNFGWSNTVVADSCRVINQKDKIPSKSLLFPLQALNKPANMMHSIQTNSKIKYILIPK